MSFNETPDKKEVGKSFLKDKLRAETSRGARSYYAPFDRDTLVYHDPTTIFDRYEFKRTQSYDISMDERQYEELLEILGSHHYPRILEQREEYERHMRAQYPAVQKAYEQYRLLLDMVNDGYNSSR